MSDLRLRTLERRWKETGAVEDEASYLAERVRTGQLRALDLEIAALCLHPAARLVTPSFATRVSDAAIFIRALRALDHWAAVRFALAVALHTLPAYVGTPTQNGTDTIQGLARTIELIMNPEGCDWGEVRALAMQLQNGVSNFDAIQVTTAQMTAFAAMFTALDSEPLAVERGVRLTLQFSMIEARSWPDDLPVGILAHVSAWALGQDPLPFQLIRLRAELR